VGQQHDLAAFIYFVAAGAEQQMDIWSHNLKLRIARATLAGAEYRLPPVDDLLAMPDFAVEREFVERWGIDVPHLQKEIDRLTEEAAAAVVATRIDAAHAVAEQSAPAGEKLEAVAPPAAGTPPDEIEASSDRDVTFGDLGSKRGHGGSGNEPRIYRVWFGTNRKPGVDDRRLTFTGERESATVHYGTCTVSIPRSHKFGSIGSSFFKRLLTLRDDRLTIREIKRTDENGFWSGIQKELALWAPDERHALVYIHGYNVSFEEAAIRAAQIGFDLKVSGVTSFFSWPSQGSLEGYPADAASIEASESAISKFLVDFAQHVAPERVHVIAHSMGNRGLLRAMQRIHADAERRSKIKFGQIFLAAPDIDADLFNDLARLYTSLCRRTTLYASPGDKAVALSRWLHGAPRAGFTPPVTVVSGIDTIEVPDFDLDALGHGYYAEAAGVLNDMFHLLRSDSPPEKRQRLQAAHRADGKLYWTMLA